MVMALGLVAWMGRNDVWGPYYRHNVKQVAPKIWLLGGKRDLRDRRSSPDPSGRQRPPLRRAVPAAPVAAGRAEDPAGARHRLRRGERRRRGARPRRRAGRRGRHQPVDDRAGEDPPPRPAADGPQRPRPRRRRPLVSSPLPGLVRSDRLRPARFHLQPERPDEPQDGELSVHRGGVPGDPPAARAGQHLRHLQPLPDPVRRRQDPGDGPERPSGRSHTSRSTTPGGPTAPSRRPSGSPRSWRPVRDWPSGLPKPVAPGGPALATDDWPFLYYFFKPTIPRHYLFALAAVAGVAALAVLAGLRLGRARGVCRASGRRSSRASSSWGPRSSSSETRSISGLRPLLRNNVGHQRPRLRGDPRQHPRRHPRGDPVAADPARCPLRGTRGVARRLLGPADGRGAVPSVRDPGRARRDRGLLSGLLRKRPLREPVPHCRGGRRQFRPEPARRNARRARRMLVAPRGIPGPPRPRNSSLPGDVRPRPLRPADPPVPLGRDRDGPPGAPPRSRSGAPTPGPPASSGCRSSGPPSPSGASRESPGAPRSRTETAGRRAPRSRVPRAGPAGRATAIDGSVFPRALRGRPESSRIEIGSR